MKAMNSVSKRILLGFLLVFLCVISSAYSQEPKRNSNPKAEEKPSNRLIDYFLIGEKATEKNKKVDVPVSGINERFNFDDINAFSIIDVKLDKSKDIFEFLKRKDKIILLVAELRKRGEKTWNRISIINKYTMKIIKATSTSTETPEDKGTSTSTETSKDSDSPIEPFSIISEILSDNPYLKEGDYVQVFYFYAGGDNDFLYRKDLRTARDNYRPLASIDSQEMYLITTGSTPEKYSAKQGDQIRLRFLRAEYPILKVPGPQRADFISAEDEDIFTYKEYGIKLFIAPTAVYGTNVATEFDWGNFNLVGKNPSVGSNIYITYEGRNPLKKVLNYLPGIHLSMLGLINSEQTDFTVGFVTSIVPFLRGYFGIFYGWYNLKKPVVGITLSPDINIKPMVVSEKSSVK